MRKSLPLGRALIVGFVVFTVGLVCVSSCVAGQGDARDRVVSWLTIGGSTPDRSTRCVGWNIKRAGWRGFVKKVIDPQIAWGCRRFVLHNPFGAFPDEDMQFDQYIHASEAGLGWLCNGFVEAWRPVTQGGAGGPIEVICYLGKLREDPDFQVLLDRGNHQLWLERAWDSMRPALDAGMSIGLDSSAPAGKDDPVFKLAELLTSLGVKVYIEARPPRANTHWFNYPVICEESFWHRSNPAEHLDSAVWAARNDQLQGEIIRIITRVKQAEQPFKARSVLAEGHTAAVYVLAMIREGVTLDSLLHGGEDYD